MSFCDKDRACARGRNLSEEDYKAPWPFVKRRVQCIWEDVATIRRNHLVLQPHSDSSDRYSFGTRDLQFRLVLSSHAFLRKSPTTCRVDREAPLGVVVETAEMGERNSTRCRGRRSIGSSWHLKGGFARFPMIDRHVEMPMESIVT